jgi:hypothetical protein
MKKTLLSTTAALAIAFAGCGDEGSEPASGPASVIPADMPLYIEATVKPEGEQAENLDALLTELSDLPLPGIVVGDPGDLIVTQLESQAAAAGIDFSYAEDVEPWLGEKAGFGIAEDAEGETRFVAALETTDEDQASESIKAILSQDEVPYEEDEYEGVTYISAPGDTYRLGVFAGHVVLAPPADFEASVDASEGDSLASNDKLTESFDQLGDEGLASLFIDLEQFTELVSTDPEGLEQAKAVVPEFFESGMAVSVGVSAGSQVYLDYVTPLFEGQPEAGASDLLGSAPDDVFGAAAIESIGAFGPPVADLLTRANEAGAELDEFPKEGLEAAFEDHVGVPLDEAADALGDASLWVRGELPDALEVAGEIEVSDTEAATALIEAIEQEVSEEEGAKLGPPVGGSDVGFSALAGSASFDSLPSLVEPGTTDCTIGVEPAEGEGGAEVEEIVEDGCAIPSDDYGHADLPFVNVELDGDVVHYGFFKDEKAAQASDPDAAGDFGETEAYAAGEEALGGDFEYIGAIDLAPILDEFVGGAGIGDVLSGDSPEELITGFLAQKLGVVAFGIRYEDDAAIQRYVLSLAE